MAQVHGAAHGRRSAIGAAVVAVILAAALPAGAAPAFGSYQRPGTNGMVSVPFDGGQADGPSYDAATSADGMVAAFFTQAENLTAEEGHRNGSIVVRDRRTGRTELASIGHDGTPPNNSSFQAGISEDGRYVAFLSFATNLVEGDDASGRAAQVYLRDRITGTTERITSSLAGGASNGAALRPRVGPGGRIVVFMSHATDLVAGDTNARADVFAYDRVTRVTRRVSTSSDGAQGDGTSSWPALSADGRFVSFASSATNLVPGDTNGVADVFVRDLQTGAIERVSSASDGTQGNFDASVSAISGDGRFVAFQSGASNLVPTDTNGLPTAIQGSDVFVHDRQTRRTERVSVTSTGEELRKSYGPSISDDGRYVAFNALRDGEDPGSFVGITDVYVHDRATGATEVASATPGGKQTAGSSENPRLTADGTAVVFQSDAPDFVPGDANETTDIVVRVRGGETDVVGIEVGGAGRRVTARTTMSGIRLAEAARPPSPAAPAGGDLVGASVTYRPEDADLLVQLDLAHLPRLDLSTATGTGNLFAGFPNVPAAGFAYGLRFALDGVPYELRASRAATTPGMARGVTGPYTGAANVGDPVPAFTLHRCAATCAQVARPGGGYGTTGDQIRISLPLSPLGSSMRTLTDLRAVVVPGDGTLGLAGAPASEIALGSITLPERTGELRVGGAVVPAGYSAGLITAELPAAPPAGTALSARVCIGDRCAERTQIIP